jgi:hypothetical protein
MIATSWRYFLTPARPLPPEDNVAARRAWPKRHYAGISMSAMTAFIFIPRFAAIISAKLMTCTAPAPASASPH